MYKYNWTNLEVFNNELSVFEDTLDRSFPIGNMLLKKTSRQIIIAEGKRLRPALVIASAMTKNYESDKVIPIACAIEVMHTATLIHDDIIDKADTRRGIQTISKSIGNKAAVLTGDYLLSKALVMIAGAELPKEHLIKIAAAIQSMCTGEIAQHYSGELIPGPRSYLKRIMQKTSLMISAACSLGAWLGGHDENTIKKFARLGLRLGTAFQIRDDLLDITIDKKNAGKPTDSDLLNGVVTMPVLMAA